MASSDLITPMVAALQYVAPSTTELRGLENSSHTPPRYVWQRVSITDAGALGGAPRRDTKLLGTDTHNILVHCWGATEDDCELMRMALVRALRNQTYAGYQLGDSTWTYPEWAPVGWVLSTQVRVQMPLVEVNIPSGALTGIPEDDVTNKTASTVTITTADHNTSSSTAGDGYLDTGEG